MESILTSIKKLLGIEEQYEQFDTDIIMCINTVLATLAQLGIGPREGFEIKDKSAAWDELLRGDKRYNLVKSYVHLRVRLLFDPPLSQAVTEVINKTVSELEWRMQTLSDYGLECTGKEEKSNER